MSDDDRVRLDLRDILIRESDTECCRSWFELRGYDTVKGGFTVGHYHGGKVWLHCATFVEVGDAERYVWTRNLLRDQE